MDSIDLNNAEQRNGAVYFVVGRGTEGGAAAYRLSVAGVGNSEWGTVSAVAANSGYSIGTIQVDLGQRGTWALGSTSGRALAPGEQSYVDAIVDQVATYAGNNQLRFPTSTQGLADLRSDLLTHGNGQNGRSSIAFITQEHRATINAWAASDEGKQWIHSHIDYPQVQSIADTAKQVLDNHGQQIPEDKRFEVLCILAKSANQHPTSFDVLERSLRNGADHEAFMASVTERAQSISYFAGDKAGELAQQYQANYQKPGNAGHMEEPHRLVAQPGYQPAHEAQMPPVQLALAAYGRDLNDPSVLDRGDTGENVRWLQRTLIGSGQTLTDDGDFGPATERALTAYQRTQGLPTTGFGDRPTLQALGLAPALDERSSASLHRMIETLHTDPRFDATQVGRIANSAQQYLLENRQSLGEVSQIRVSTNGQTLLFLNDYAQMRSMEMDHAIQGHVPVQLLINPPAAEPAREGPVTQGPIH